MLLGERDASMSKMTDEKLIARARHAARNLSVLAAIATSVSIGLVAIAVSIKNTALFMAPPAITLTLIATGYWLLAAAARRGNPSSVGIVIAVMVLQLAIALVSNSIIAATSGADVRPGTPGLIIPVIVTIVLAGNRKALLELQKRGLWNGIFGTAKPSGRLCVIGGTLLAAGFVSVNGFSVYAAWLSGRERHVEIARAEGFVDMINTGEQAFLKAMERLSGDYGTEELHAALDKAAELERRAEALKAAGANKDPFCSIMGTYCNAVRQWKNGLALLNSADPDFERAQQMLALGDKLRRQAGQEFSRRYVSK